MSHTSNHFSTYEIGFFFFLLTYLIFNIELSAQKDEYVIAPPAGNLDFDYSSNIKSVQFYQDFDQLTYPILLLNDRNGILTLDFDLLGEDEMNLMFRIDHFNSDWTESDIDHYEFLEGFSESDIFDVQYSWNTRIPYIHYRLEIPNQDVSFTKSGNYLITVFNEDDPDEVLLTRRFFIIEPIVGFNNTGAIGNNYFEPFVNYTNLHFDVLTDNLNVNNPYAELSLSLYTNGQWNFGKHKIFPRNAINEKVRFERTPEMSLPLEGPHRFFDYRSVRFDGDQVNRLLNEDTLLLILEPDEAYARDRYNVNRDYLGSYYIENFDEPNEMLQSEYAKVVYVLASDEPGDSLEIFVTGKYNNWEQSDRTKMKWDEENKAYLYFDLVKQGFYNYQYMAHFDDGNKFTLSNKQENYPTEYLAMIYYKPFGARYERLVGARVFRRN